VSQADLNIIKQAFSNILDLQNPASRQTLNALLKKVGVLKFY
jgi:hypothetical protein